MAIKRELIQRGLITSLMIDPEVTTAPTSPHPPPTTTPLLLPPPYHDDGLPPPLFYGSRLPSSPTTTPILGGSRSSSSSGGDLQRPVPPSTPLEGWLRSREGPRWVRSRVGSRGGGGSSTATSTTNKCLLYQDRARIPDYSRATVITLWLLEDGAVEVLVRDVDRAIDLLPMVVAPLFIDKMCGMSSFELMEMREAERKEGLGPLFSCLRVGEDRSSSSGGGSMGVYLQVDCVIYKGNHFFHHRKYIVTVSRLPTTSTTTTGGILITTNPYAFPNDPSKALTIIIHDDELEVLLCNQPSLFQNITTKWSSQRSIAEWLVTRLRVTTDSHFLSFDDRLITTSQLSIDRTIILPPAGHGVLLLPVLLPPPLRLLRVLMMKMRGKPT